MGLYRRESGLGICHVWVWVRGVTSRHVLHTDRMRSGTGGGAGRATRVGRVEGVFTHD